MHRFLSALFLTTLFFSCSKKENTPLPPAPIPDQLNGTVYEFNVTPINVTTPGKGFLLISVNNTVYRVVFNAVDSAQSNAVLYFASDTILTDQSREFTNLGKDVVAYNPVKDNEIQIRFYDGRKVTGQFDITTNFGGTFGEQVIAQWREANDPSKPNQKAKDDLMNLVHRYYDQDGPGGSNKPTYLSVSIIQQ